MFSVHKTIWKVLLKIIWSTFLQKRFLLLVSTWEMQSWPIYPTTKLSCCCTCTHVVVFVNRCNSAFTAHNLSLRVHLFPSLQRCLIIPMHVNEHFIALWMCAEYLQDYCVGASVRKENVDNDFLHNLGKFLTYCCAKAMVTRPKKDRQP